MTNISIKERAASTVTERANDYVYLRPTRVEIGVVRSSNSDTKYILHGLHIAFLPEGGDGGLTLQPTRRVIGSMEFSESTARDLYDLLREGLEIEKKNEGN